MIAYTRRLTAPFAAALALLSGTAAAQTEIVAEKLKHGEVNWTEKTVIATGTDMRGVTVDMSHSTAFRVDSIENVGPFLDGNCEIHVESGRLRTSCVRSTDVDAPFDAWALILSHAPDVRVEDEITSLACTGSDRDGDTFAIGCDID